MHSTEPRTLGLVPVKTFPWNMGPFLDFSNHFVLLYSPWCIKKKIKQLTREKFSQ